MAAPVLNHRPPPEPREWPPMAALERVLHFFTGVFIPVWCFMLSPEVQERPSWRDGRWDNYLLFVFDGRYGYAFYPLVAFSMASLVAFICDFSVLRWFWVRLGLYTGLVVSLQYMYLESLTVYSSATGPLDPRLLLMLCAGATSAAVLFGGLRLVFFAWRRVADDGRFAIVTALVLGIPILGFVAFQVLRRLPEETGFSLVFNPPAWCAGTYALTAWAAFQWNREGQVLAPSYLGKTLASLAWIGAFFGAWKWSLIQAMAAYAALPTTPPRSDCYIATAAAAGHPKLVGSRRAVAADGSVFVVNQQLRRLKCAEIALATLCPAFRRSLRFVYDRVGPRAANVIRQHPLLADSAYLLLKPVELMAFGCVTLICAKAAEFSKMVY